MSMMAILAETQAPVWQRVPETAVRPLPRFSDPLKVLAGASRGHGLLLVRPRQKTRPRVPLRPHHCSVLTSSSARGGGRVRCRGRGRGTARPLQGLPDARTRRGLPRDPLHASAFPLSAAIAVSDPPWKCGRLPAQGRGPQDGAPSSDLVWQERPGLAGPPHRPRRGQGLHALLDVHGRTSLLCSRAMKAEVLQVWICSYPVGS